MKVLEKHYGSVVDIIVQELDLGHGSRRNTWAPGPEKADMVMGTVSQRGILKVCGLRSLHTLLTIIAIFIVLAIFHNLNHVLLSKGG